MNKKQVPLALAAAALGALLIVPAAASAKGPRECGHRGCYPAETHRERRWHRPSRRPIIIIYPAAQGDHAIRGWAPRHDRYFDGRRGGIATYPGGRR